MVFCVFSHQEQDLLNSAHISRKQKRPKTLRIRIAGYEFHTCVSNSSLLAFLISWNVLPPSQFVIKCFSARIVRMFFSVLILFLLPLSLVRLSTAKPPPSLRGADVPFLDECPSFH